MEGNFIDDLFS